MAWFRKEKKPRQPLKARLEIPADVWEKCESCGHTDIREKFQQSFNVCPACAFHRRLRAIEYTTLLLDEGSIEEIEPPITLALAVACDPFGNGSVPLGKSGDVMVTVGTLL